MGCRRRRPATQLLARLTTDPRTSPERTRRALSRTSSTSRPLTEEEFASAKKCARSRFTLAGLNELVVAFNAALDAKYALLELPKSRLTGSAAEEDEPLLPAGDVRDERTALRHQQRPQHQGQRVRIDPRAHGFHGHHAPVQPAARDPLPAGHCAIRGGVKATLSPNITARRC
ncbi:hypothetical protein HPB48_024021 [Haemaphysalis longicornis]|uniref:SKA complex subunit 1 n=1 Tax=Haemaphysalis longicornis TaxID=44386 RepID=A0A9J6H6C8_HAELO|nr:hypothetical protein HPB48_024021 [Haemaphysalis longicornis]